ncbi:MAG: class I SAM-dependent methyltransferase [Myxococcota bacterium]|jgi:SAM-dependent methyltransferase
MSARVDDYGPVTSRYYDDAYAALRDASGDANWYLGLAREAKGPVLELGCGTGRALLPVAIEGIACTGLDASPAMLDVLRSKNPPDNLRLVEGNLQDFDLGEERFALIFAAFRVFQHLYTVEDQLACLARVRSHLAPSGAFAFDAFVPRMARMAIEREPEAQDVRFEQGGDEIVRYVSVRRNIPEQLTELCMRYERRSGGRVVGNETVEFQMRHFFRYELEHLLERAGFDRIELYGDFDRTPFGAGATSFVVVARASSA